ncbi:hypothetical protein DFH11DRAFT_1739620 [Phellopilus nigrolimitatus]|nr:hypothetical protein DFH11DRAFT_1739620 [Phellopilus nigrolimitatus]
MGEGRGREGKERADVMGRTRVRGLGAVTLGRGPRMAIGRSGRRPLDGGDNPGTGLDRLDKRRHTAGTRVQRHEAGEGEGEGREDTTYNSRLDSPEDGRVGDLRNAREQRKARAASLRLGAGRVCVPREQLIMGLDWQKIVSFGNASGIEIGIERSARCSCRPGRVAYGTKETSAKRAENGWRKVGGTTIIAEKRKRWAKAYKRAQGMVELKGWDR